MPRTRWQVHILSGKQQGNGLGYTIASNGLGGHHTCNRLNLREKWASMYITIKLFMYDVCTLLGSEESICLHIRESQLAN
jgi:hypothetical protein